MKIFRMFENPYSIEIRLKVEQKHCMIKNILQKYLSNDILTVINEYVF
jgi:hypothetical protein